MKYEYTQQCYISQVSLKNTPIMMSDGYCLRSDCGWFSSLLWKILDKLKSLDIQQHKVDVWTYTNQDAGLVTHELLEKIPNQLNIMMEFGTKEFVILMGGVNLQDIISSPTLTNMVTLKFGPLGYKNVRCGGLPVVIVPELNGIVVIPKDSLPEREI